MGLQKLELQPHQEPIQVFESNEPFEERLSKRVIEVGENRAWVSSLENEEH
jgi:hypothetical protein